MAASGAIKASRDCCWERRTQRFADVVCAIDSLIDWLKLERTNYKERTIVTAKSRQPRKTHGHPEKRVAEDIHQAECTIHGGEHIGLGNRAASGAEDLTLDDRKGQEQAASGADSMSSSSSSSNSSSRSSSSSRQQQTGADGRRRSSELHKVLLLEKKLATLSKVHPSTSTAPGESHSEMVCDIFRNQKNVQCTHHWTLRPLAKLMGETVMTVNQASMIPANLTSLGRPSP